MTGQTLLELETIPATMVHHICVLAKLKYLPSKTTSRHDFLRIHLIPTLSKLKRSSSCLPQYQYLIFNDQSFSLIASARQKNLFPFMAEQIRYIANQLISPLNLVSCFLQSLTQWLFVFPWHQTFLRKFPYVPATLPDFYIKNVPNKPARCYRLLSTQNIILR